MMKKTIYLHTGMMKTASTSIQQFLYTHRINLEKYNLFYPLIKNTQNPVNLRLFFCKNFDFSNAYQNLHPHFLTQTSGTKALYKEQFEKVFLEQIIQSVARNIIFSEEIMSSLIITLRSFIEVLIELGFSVKIIAYVRPPADWVTSKWNELSKISSTHLSLADYIYKNYDFIDFRHFHAYINLLGKENVIIRPYEKEQWKNHNIIEDFLDIFNIELSDLKFLNPQSHNQQSTNRLDSNVSSTSSTQAKKHIAQYNVSPSRNTAELCRILTHAGAFKYAKPKPALQKLLKLDTSGTKTIETLTDAEILELTERTRPVYEKLARVYDKESFFLKEFPSCYGKERPEYKNVTISPEQLEIMLEALKTHKEETEARIAELETENKGLRAQIENL